MTCAIEEYNDALQSGRITACKKLKAVYKHLVKNIKNPGKIPFITARKQPRRPWISSRISAASQK